MNATKYTTKAGATQFRPTDVSPDELQDGSVGFCLACGQEASGVEPDARRYRCEGCGASKVYGLEELLVMGLLTVSTEEAQ